MEENKQHLILLSLFGTVLDIPVLDFSSHKGEKTPQKLVILMIPFNDLPDDPQEAVRELSKTLALLMQRAIADSTRDPFKEDEKKEQTCLDHYFVGEVQEKFRVLLKEQGWECEDFTLPILDLREEFFSAVLHLACV